MCNTARFLILFLPPLFLRPLCLKTRIYLLLLSKASVKMAGKMFHFRDEISRESNSNIKISHFSTQRQFKCSKCTHAIPIMTYFSVIKAVSRSKHRSSEYQG